MKRRKTHPGDMFFLVKFHNDELYIAPAAQVKRLQANDCLVKYKGQSRYEAQIIRSHSCKAELQKLQELEQARLNSENIIDLDNIYDDNNGIIDKKSEDKNKSEKTLVDDDSIQTAGCSTPIDAQSSAKMLPLFLDMIPILDETVEIDSTNDNTTKKSSSLPPSDVSSLIHYLGEDWFQNSFVQDSKRRSAATDVNDNSIRSNDNIVEPDRIHILEIQNDLPMDGETNAIIDDVLMNKVGMRANSVEHDRDKAQNILNIMVELPKNRDEVTTIKTVNVTTDDISNNQIEHENFDLTNPMQNSDTISEKNISSDSDYIPSNHTSLRKSCDSRNDSTKHTTDNSIDASSCFPPINIQELKIPCSRGEQKNANKKDFCMFCKTFQTKLARHLELMHKNEEKVKNFIYLPKGLLQRKRKIDAIRREGNAIHNMDPTINSGILITCRRKQVKSQNTAEDYLICTKCRGFFSKRTLRIHYSKCNKQHQKGIREIAITSRRKTGYIHPSANNILRRVVFPILNDDEITRLIKFDELIILAGNKFCEKYTLQHQHDLIRSNLRLLGRFKRAVMEKDPSIQEFSSVFQPKYYDVTVEAVRECAGYNWETQIFKSPSVATTLGTLLKKCANLWKTECIKKSLPEKREETQQFLELYDMDFPTTINKKVIEDQVKQKRNKKIILPLKSDIQKLHTFLKKKGHEAVSILREGFESSAWKSLCEVCLILVQMFNRRRAGEIERLLISDYNNRESVDEHVNPDLYANLSEKSREYAKKYVRLTIRGKLGRIVPVLLDTTLVQWIETILKHRSNAGVRSDNQFVFALPKCNKLAKGYLRACTLMRKFSEECGARMPMTLRGTTLRKHIATYTAMLNIEESQITDLANFMGHTKDIHKGFYRVPGPVKDVTDVSQLLQAAIGIDENDAYEDSDDDGDDLPEQNNNCKLSRKRRVSDVSSEMVEDANCSNTSRKRSTSPYGKTKRKRWTEDEKSAVSDFFGDIQKLTKLPSLYKCQEAITQNLALRHRKPQQLKTWIDNQRRVMERKPKSRRR